jgi:hypothetical protein
MRPLKNRFFRNIEPFYTTQQVSKTGVVSPRVELPEQIKSVKFNASLGDSLSKMPNLTLSKGHKDSSFYT